VQVVEGVFRVRLELEEVGVIVYDKASRSGFGGPMLPDRA